jgi:phosphate transport system permease protein
MIEPENRAAAPLPAASSSGAPLMRARGPRRLLEKIAESVLFLLAASIILIVFLIFAFVFKNALSIFFQRTSTAVVEAEVIRPEDLDSVEPARLAAYLKLESVEELKEYDQETLLFLLEAAAEESGGSTNPDRAVNALSYRNMLWPRQWQGYDEPVYIWQPVSEAPKYNIIPLFVGSLKATFVAMALAVPLSFVAALYVSQFASWRTRQFIKPAIELLAGIPSVALGMFALMVMASAARAVFGFEARLNAIIAGAALGLAVVPIVFTIMEDVMSAVPKVYVLASLALGANRWQTAIKVVTPAALPGLFAATMLGFGRALGETMVVLMASGNAPILSWNLADPIRAVTATIASELPDTQFGDHHYQALFFLGSLLFLITFAANFGGEIVARRLRRRLEGRG